MTPGQFATTKEALIVQHGIGLVSPAFVSKHRLVQAGTVVGVVELDTKTDLVKVRTQDSTDPFWTSQRSLAQA